MSLRSVAVRVEEMRDGEMLRLFAGLSDVHIQCACVPRLLPAATAEGVLWQAAPSQFLLHVPGVARFLVEFGRSITIEPEPGSSPSERWRFLRMTPLAALLYQRGALAFHAAAASSKGAVLLAGDSGAGKSALLMALLERGWTMLADELAFVDLDSLGTAQVAPTFPDIRLWRKSLGNPTSESEHDSASSWRTVSMTDQFPSSPRALRAIVWLTVHNDHQIEIRELDGMERFRSLALLTYNSHIADALLDRAQYLRQAGHIARSCRFWKLCRPRGRDTVAELADWMCTEMPVQDGSRRSANSAVEAGAAP